MFRNLIFLLLISICAGQFILEPREKCQFEIDRKKLEVISELAIVDLKSQDLTIAISPCVHFSRLPQKQKSIKLQKCTKTSRACIIEGDSVKNAGDRFIYSEIDDGSESEKVLISLNGEQCKNNKNYRVIVHFDCKKVTPSYLSSDDYEDEDQCTYHIRMIAPYCTPPCMVRVSGQFLDLKPLAMLPDMVVPLGDNKSAIFSMCRPSKTCDANNNTVACEAKLPASENGNNVIISALGTKSSEKMLWDESTQQIQLRSQIGSGKKNRRITEIRLVCNWDWNWNNPRLIKSTTKIIIFEVESKFGCVKTVPNCTITSLKGFTYNLENLYKTENWLLDKTNNKKIALNICGPLRVPQGSLCQKRNSQICDEDGTTNYGTIMRPIQVDHSDDSLFTTFIGGSFCTSSKNTYYSTNIKFICSSTKNNPALLSQDNCNLNILWETPEACPKYIASGNNCKVPIVYFKNGLLDLNELHSSMDRIVSLSEDVNLRYNFCGKLSSPCNNISESSMCLIKNGHESVLGLENNNVIFENGLLRSYFYKNVDFDKQKPNVNVLYICNHNQPKEGAISISQVQSNVAYQVTVETPLACSTDITYPCTLTHENQFYDLTPLMKNDSNYELSSSEYKLQINICRPILTDGQSLCDLNALSCLTNLTEPSLTNKRYKSMGRTQEIFFKNDLTVKYNWGSLCIESKSSYMETTILFSCSPNQEQGPILFENNKCNKTITWATKYACPKKLPPRKRSEKECLIKSADKILYNFTSLKSHTLYIRLDKNISIELNICSGSYQLYYGAELHNNFANRILFPNENNSYLQYELIDNYVINLNLICEHDKAKEGFENNPLIHGKRIEATLRSLQLCVQKNESVVAISTEVAVPEIEVKLAPNFREDQFKKIISEVKVVSSSKNVNCVITSPLTFKTFQLNSLPPIFVKSTKHLYNINFQNTSNCTSYVCKDNMSFVKYDKLECPNYYLDDDILKIKFVLLNESACKGRDLVGFNIILECGLKEYSSLKQESDCFIVINHESPLLCPFKTDLLTLIDEDKDNYKYKLGGIISSCLIVSIILLWTILRYVHKRRQAMSPPLSSTEFTTLFKQD